MNSILNITNGDSAVEIMKSAGIPGDHLPWRDILHEGPVPENRSLEELSEIRAKFISDRWGNAKETRQSFIERDTALKSYQDYEKVILWFEHDLYDQLQLLQILDWFQGQELEETTLSLICTDQYLGTLSPGEMASLFKYEEPITAIHLELASKAWSAFRSSTPLEWFSLLKTDTTVLPFLAGAIIRQLEEYPRADHGLSRTAHEALKIISLGEKHPVNVFSRYQESEERQFLGDSSFWLILHELLDSPTPLLKLPEGKVLMSPISPDLELSTTPAGEDVLSGKRNWLQMTEIDRWIGGVHLTPENIWYWDSNSDAIVKA